MSTKKMFGYNLHGLRVNSELVFDHYPQKNIYKNPHAVLKIGKVKKPIQDQEDTLYRPFTIANKDIYYQSIPSIAQYYIEGKKRVTIEVSENKNRAAQLFFLDTILPILLIKNEKFAVHASAVKTKNGVFLFTAPRGAGKSTIAASLVMSGAKVISDDICILKWDNKSGKFITKCYHPHVQVWKNVLPVLGKSAKSLKINQVRKGILKFDLDFSKYSYKKYHEVAGIISIVPINEELELVHEKLTGMAKINLSRNIIHTSQVSQYIASHKQLFEYSANIAKNLDLHIIKRSRLTGVKKFTKYVIEQVIN